jgi:hypothetical protein
VRQLRKSGKTSPDVLSRICLPRRDNDDSSFRDENISRDIEDGLGTRSGGPRHGGIYSSPYVLSRGGRGGDLFSATMMYFKLVLSWM